MSHPEHRAVERDARLFVSDGGAAILMHRGRPAGNRDIVVCDDIRVAEPTWRPLEIGRGDPDGTLRCRDPYRRAVRTLRSIRGDLWMDEVAYRPAAIRATAVAVLPTPRQRLLQHVYEVPETGARVALYADPNQPLTRAVWVRIGSRRSPDGWRWAEVQGVSRDGRAISTSLGTLDLSAMEWAGYPLEELPPRTEGVPLDDAWRVMRTGRARPDRPGWRLTLGAVAFLAVLAIIAVLAL